MLLTGLFMNQDDHWFVPSLPLDGNQPFPHAQSRSFHLTSRHRRPLPFPLPSLRGHSPVPCQERRREARCGRGAQGRAEEEGREEGVVRIVVLSLQGWISVSLVSLRINMMDMMARAHSRPSCPPLLLQHPLHPSPCSTNLTPKTRVRRPSSAHSLRTVFPRTFASRHASSGPSPSDEGGSISIQCSGCA